MTTALFKALLCVYLCLLTNANRSKRSCEDLVSLVGDWSTYGSAVVCGASKVVFDQEYYKETGQLSCAEAETWAGAGEKCTAVGMRLCTVMELMSDETRQTGCGWDTKRVWSADNTGCQKGRALSLAGSSTFLDRAPIECIPDDSLFGVRCCADTMVDAVVIKKDVCEQDECATSGSAANVCIVQPGGRADYLCTCGGLGWRGSANGKACIVSQVCGANECSHDDLAEDNACLVVDADTYACMCNPALFHAAPDAQSCIPRTCLANECGQDTTANDCRDNLDSTHRCTCSEPGFGMDRTGTKCVTHTPQCLLDECLTSEDRENMCVDHNVGTYHCECGGFRFLAAADRQGCAPQQPACLADSCGADTNRNNKCVDNGDETYFCTCDPMSHLAASEDGLDCVAVKPRCLSDECLASKGNKCVDQFDGLYACQCLGDYVAATGVKEPVCKVKPCKANECRSRENSGNKCVLMDNFAGYECRCGGQWKSRKDGTTCVEQKCIANANTCSELESNGANSCKDNGDGTYHCQCEGLWYAPPSMQKCVRRRCYENECSDLEDFRNVCIDRFDGTFACQCGLLWNQGPSDQSCERLVCVSNECNQDLDVGNTCTDLGGGEYKCNCAPEWRLLETEKGMRCDPPLNPCDYDPCRVEGNYGNLCAFDRPRNRYTCTCKEVGWVRDQGLDDRDVCVPVASACRGDPCGSRVDRDNLCIDHRDGTYMCKCDGNRFGQGEGSQSCVHHRNWCLTQPCGKAPGNVCNDHGDSTYHCTCGARGWRPSGNTKACEVMPDPCEQDPCNRYGDPSNVCIDNLDGTRQCVCNANRYMTRVSPDDGMSECRHLPNPCAKYPCGELKSQLNTCADLGDGERFRCFCGGFGYSQGPADGSCVMRPNKCADHPCGENIVSGNSCLDLRDGTHVCLCEHKRWRLAMKGGQQTCIAPANLCDDALDYCHTDAGNECVDKHDGSFYCKCVTEGWAAPFNSQTCVPPVTVVPTPAPLPNACNIEDPCSHLDDPGNMCVDLRPAPRIYACECNTLRGWTPNNDSSHCAAPVNQCVHLHDACNRTGDYRNRCEDYKDGTYRCHCDGVAWTASPDGQICTPPINMCTLQNDFCLSKLSDGNTCVDLGRARYKCVCNGRGFTTSGQEQFCREAKNACDSQPCGAPALNRCGSAADGTYRCTCGATGWANTPDLQRCLPPKNPCLTQDPCRTFEDRFNICNDNQDGTFGCVCQGRGWTESSDSLKCLPPINACEAPKDAVGTWDPCSNMQHPRNYCSDKMDGTYECICKGPKWTHAEDLQSCVCPDLCKIGDPCLSSQDENNKCIYDATTSSKDRKTRLGPFGCGFHKCECADGWTNVDDGMGSERCAPPDPCRNGADPCSGKIDGLNQCISLYAPPVEVFQIIESDPASRIQENVWKPEPVQRPLGLVPGLGVNTLAKPSVAGLGYQTAGRAPVMPARGAFATMPTLVGRTPAVAATRSAASQSSVRAAAVVRPRQGVDAAVAPLELERVRRGASIEEAPTRRNHVPAEQGLMHNMIVPGAYLCKCDAKGWVTPIGGQSCTKPDPCRLGDPCKSHGNPDNLCIAGRYDGFPQETSPYFQDYHCECRGRGWFTPANRQYCDRCSDPCDRNGDACGGSMDPSNECLWDFTGFFESEAASLHPVHDYTGNNPGLTVDAQYQAMFSPNLPTHASSNPFVSEYYTNDDTNPFNNYYYPYVDGFVPTATARQMGVGNVAVVSRGNITKASVRGTWPNERRTRTGDTPSRRSHLEGAVGPRDVAVGECGAYRCQCDGESWAAPLGLQQCVLCNNPCYSDPCKNTFDNSNTCTFNFRGKINSVYDANSLDPDNINNAYMASPGSSYQWSGRRLVQKSQNPDSLQSRAQNVGPRPPGYYDFDHYTVEQEEEDLPGFQYDFISTDPDVCGNHKCTCDGQGWRAPLGDQSCEMCKDPCSADPCGNMLDLNNACISSFNSVDFYENYWLEDYLDADIKARKGADFKDDCADYICVCDSTGFVAGPNRQSCEMCIDPCMDYTDPCNTGLSGGNICIPLVDDSITRRQGRGRPANVSSSAAEPRSFASDLIEMTLLQRFKANQGQQGSPQSSSNSQFPNQLLDASMSNAAQFGSFVPNDNSGARYNTIDTDMPLCGTFTCQCDSDKDWRLSGDGKGCDPVCSNLCAVSDPCNSLEQPLNRCKFTPSKKASECGHHKCTCSADWIPTFGAQGCHRLAKNACQKAGDDPCNNGIHEKNVCVLKGQDDYWCSCGAPGFQSDGDGKACIIVGPFGLVPGGAEDRTIGGIKDGCKTHDKCVTYLNPANKCMSKPQGEFECRCQQKGFAANFDKSACVRR